MKFSHVIYASLIVLNVGCGGSSSDDDEANSTSTDTPSSQVITLTGSGVKGPMANADVFAYQVDYTEADFRGALLASGTTDATAQISGIELSESLTGYIILEFTANAQTTDLSTGNASLYDLLYTAVSTSSIFTGESVYATPLTTVAVDLAITNADQPNPYSGNNDGAVTDTEFEAALSMAQLQVKATLGFGLADDIDIFSVPPLLTNATDTVDEQLATLAYRQANEALAAVTAEISNTSTTDDTAQDIFEALIDDIQDGEIDGKNDGDDLAVLTALDQTIAEELSAIDVDLLLVPGTQTLVVDIETILIDETQNTGTEVDTSTLAQDSTVIELDDIALFLDVDGDGVADGDDAFPLDATESVDSDNDGAGDNSDAFINDPTEWLDSDNDQVGDNADAFPEDASESVDTDADGVGDNADDFPEDATETLDSDDDGVGDNSDAYPDDPEKTLLEAIELSVWLGESSGTISLPDNANGVEIYSSNDVDCDITNYSSCLNGGYQLFSGQDFSVNAALFGTSSYHHIVSPNTTSVVEVGTSRFSKRKNTQVLVFNDRMWVIAGYDAQGQNQEVWSSQDGDTWVEVTDQAAFGERFDHSVAVFNHKMWLIGGTRYADNAATIRLNDVWSSSDGKNWILENDAPPFSLRSTPSLLAFENKLWMMAGTGEDYTGKNDVWYSENGIDWIQATAEAPWEPLSYTNVIDFNNQMMLIGGGGLYEKVWTSTNGADWTEQSTNYPARNVSSVTVHDDKVWITGGYANSGYLNDVWVSNDGLTYTEVDSNYFFKRAEPGFISFDDRLWIIGGRQGSSYGDVMSSQSGIHWIRHNFGPADMQPRYYHSLTHFDDKLFLLGGSSFTDDESIWASEDGLRWEQVVETAPFDNRYYLNAIAFNDKLFVYGGILKDGINAIHAKNDIWSSVDGVNWTEEAQAAEFPERAQFGLTQWNGKLWMVGGWTQRSASELNDVWSSADGITWQLATDDGAFPARKNHGLVVLNDKLWLIGGQGTSGHLEDIWSSTDGINWTEETLISTTLFRPRDVGVRRNFKAISHNDKIFVVSGSDSGALLSDVWSSTDGTTWVEETDNTGFKGRGGFDMTIFNDAMWLQGGVYSDGISYHLKDVWRSSNGADWQAGFYKEVPIITE